MFLKRIELFGFKSFADKSVIHVSDDLSVIVGPNGCGKSNVVDAVRWVLGAQNPKGIRINNMSAVIFNGSKTRKPLNIAEVSMVFSNEDRVLPLDFNEVSIKRRVHRTGVSDYFINNSQVSLKELRDTFYDTGIGLSDYMILEQGRIDKILEAKAEERRKILEEAAGISKFRIRSVESMNRLQKVEANMVQVEQLFGEVQSQYGNLKKQSEQAKKYRDLNQKMFHSRVVLACKKHLELGKTKKEQEKTEQTLALSHESAEQVLSKLVHNDTELNKTIQEKERNIFKNQQFVQNISAEKKMILEYIQSLDELCRERSAQLNNTKQRFAMQTTRLKNIEEQRGRYQREAVSQKESISSIEKQILSLEKRINATQARMESLEKRKEEKLLLEKKKSRALTSEQEKLRSVVDLLAEELDKHMKVEGNSFVEQKKTQKELQLQLQQIEKKAQALTTKINDALRVKGSLDLRRINKDAEQLCELSKSNMEVYEKFCAMIPTFLQDFVKENGILSRKHTIDESISSLQTSIQQIAQDVRDLNGTLVELDADVGNTKDAIQDHRIQLESFYQGLKFSHNQEQKLRQDEKEIQTFVTEISKQKKKDEEFIALKTKEKKEREKQLDALFVREKKAKKDSEVLQVSIGAENTALHSFRQKIIKQEEKKEQIYKRLIVAQQKKEKILLQTQVLEESFYNSHGSHLHTFLQDDTFSSALRKNKEKIEMEIAQNQERLRELGAVNLLAEEEFAQVQERHDLLRSQLDDLSTAKEDLKKVMRNIEEKSEKKLLFAYNEVRKQFRKLFSSIMGGGSADIYFTDTDDILNSGLEIVAQPSDKKNQLLSQLSGGERALIAVILIFALYSFKPAPFCILDEIDAPLDDSNIDKFIVLLQQFTDQSQFLIISHNKRTIAHGKNIIGITMEDQGVSKLMHVKVEA